MNPRKRGIDADEVEFVGARAAEGKIYVRPGLRKSGSGARKTHKDTGQLLLCHGIAVC
jgi:hypothetical protein